MRRPGLIILAAGGSSRMGVPKQLLPWGDSTLLRHACTTALQTQCTPVIVVLGCDADRCRPSCEHLPLTIVDNPDWAQGLGTSLATAMSALVAADPNASGALVMLADQPAVSPALLEMLIAQWEPPKWPIAAVLYGEDAGVPALFDRSYFQDLLALRHDRGARALLARERSRVAMVAGGDRLFDVDTPAAYRAHRPDSTDRVHLPAGDFTD
jgi:molybdenum cofactor cytidylyltransferase